MQDNNNINKNKRIALNSIYLYLRMIFVVCINLYSSRLVLQYLGVKDFGVYNIVGGIVALMMFVNSTMRGATSRFISYSIGQNERRNIEHTIKSAVQIHILLALFLLLLGETLGLWFVNTQLNLPQGSIRAVNWLYQFSLLTSIVAILQVPLNACVISYERMGVFAIIEVVNVVLKFIIILCIVFFYDRLIAYGGLLFLEAILVFVIYWIYCRKKIRYFNLSFVINKNISEPMLLFALYDLFGNGTFAVRQQGINILINRFFGVTLNAASGVATQVSSTISTFINNILSAFKPQIIKEFSVGNIDRMQKLMRTECEIMLLLASCIFIPLFYNLEFVMQLWLVEVPVYAVGFCRILLCTNMLSIVYSVFCDGIHATGNMKRFSFYAGIFNLLSLLVTFLFFKFCFEAQYAYVSIFMCVCVQILCSAYILNKQIKELNVIGILFSAIKSMTVVVLACMFTFTVLSFVNDCVYRLMISVIVNIIVVLLLVACFYKKYRKILFHYLSMYLKKRFNM